MRAGIQEFIDYLQDCLGKNQEPKLGSAATRYLNLLVESEQAHHPEFHIRLLKAENPLDAVLQEFGEGKAPTDQRWHALINLGCPTSSGHHRLAASISHDPSKPKHVSVVFIESWLDFDRSLEIQKAILKRLHAQGYKFGFAYLEPHTQKGQGCTFFALKNIKYMADSAAIDRIHQKLQKVMIPTIDQRSLYGAIRVNCDFLEPRFFKHSSSLTVANDYLRKNPHMATQPVNRKGVLLGDRIRADYVERKSGDKVASYSNSIEKVRIKKYQQILQCLSHSPKLDIECLEGPIGAARI